jgi:hypothetical protein
VAAESRGSPGHPHLKCLPTCWQLSLPEGHTPLLLGQMSAYESKARSNAPIKCLGYQVYCDPEGSMCCSGQGYRLWRQGHLALNLGLST